MAKKISTLVLNVDLDCPRCYKKIRKLLCKHQDKEDIKTISFDEASNTVTISGPFDPEKLSKKLRCEAGKVIMDTQVRGKEMDSGNSKKAKPVKKVRFEEAEAKAARADAAAVETVTVSRLEAPRSEPAAVAVAPAAQGTSVPSIWAAGPGWCCYRPAYEAWYGGWRCCSCGRVAAAGWGGGAPPVGGWYYGAEPALYGQGYRPCGEEGEADEAACSVM